MVLGSMIVTRRGGSPAHSAGLVEELIRQRDVIAIDVLHLRDLGDVRRAVLVAGGHHRRQNAFSDRRSTSSVTVFIGQLAAAPGPGV